MAEAIAPGGVIDPDELPLLPRGAVVFADLPARALLLEALAPAIGNGLLRVHAGFGSAVVLVREGALYETHAFSRGEGARSGDRVLDDVRSWPDAQVSADRLDLALVDLCAALLRGETLYEDLRLEWTDWTSLLRDLGRRGGAFVVELATPSGRGVTCLSEGNQLLSYTDIHPSLGDPAILEAMAAAGDGRVRVRRVEASTLGAHTVFGTQMPTGPLHVREVDPPSAPAPAWPREVELATDPGPVSPAPSLATFTGSEGSTPAPAAAAPAEAPDAGGDTLRPSIEVLLPDLSWVAPWQVGWRAGNGDRHEPAEQVPARTAETAAPRPASAPAPSASGLDGLTVNDVHPQLRAIAQRRLQMSAARVEVALDSAAAQGLPLDRVLDDLRGLSIRGVMQPSIDAMVDEMAAAARQVTR